MAKTNTRNLWNNNYTCADAEVLKATIDKEIEDFDKMAGKLAERKKSAISSIFAEKRPYVMELKVVAVRGENDAIQYSLVASATK